MSDISHPVTNVRFIDNRVGQWPGGVKSYKCCPVLLTKHFHRVGVSYLTQPGIIRNLIWRCSVSGWPGRIRPFTMCGATSYSLNLVQQHDLDPALIEHNTARNFNEKCQKQGKVMYQLLTVLCGLSEKCFQPTGNIFKYFNWLNYLRTDVIKSPARHKFKEGVFSGEENSSIELAWSGSDLIWSGVAPVRPPLLYYSTGQAEAQTSGALKLNSPFLFSIEFKHTKVGGEGGCPSRETLPHLYIANWAVNFPEISRSNKKNVLEIKL